MRLLALAAIVLVAGCDVLFGLERSPVPDADVPVDAPAVITGLRTNGPVKVGGDVMITVTFHHEPQSLLPFELTASAGVLGPVAPVQLDDLGNGVATVRYVAPASAIAPMITFTARAAGDVETLDEPLLAGATYGTDAMGVSTILQGGDTVYGTQLKIANPGSVTQLGIWVSTGGPVAKLALYTDAGGPASLVTQTFPIQFSTGRNVASASATVPAGMYWVLVLLDSATSIQITPGGGAVSRATMYSAGFPPTFQPSLFTQMSGTTPSMFVKITP